MEEIKNYNRWPIKRKKTNVTYGDRLALLMGLIANQEDDPNNIQLFLPSKVYFVRAALEAKFGRHFSPKEIKQIINDKSWQTQGTPSQAFDKQEGTVPFSNATTLSHLNG